jgi:hypothetical protein
MDTNAEFVPKAPDSDLGGSSLMLVNLRLKKLRRERHLVKRAIIALTALAQARGSRDRRRSRN